MDVLDIMVNFFLTPPAPYFGGAPLEMLHIFSWSGNVLVVLFGHFYFRVELFFLQWSNPKHAYMSRVIY